jgi:hypothetical protein
VLLPMLALPGSGSTGRRLMDGIENRFNRDQNATRTCRRTLRARRRLRPQSSAGAPRHVERAGSGARHDPFLTSIHHTTSAARWSLRRSPPCHHPWTAPRRRRRDCVEHPATPAPTARRPAKGTLPIGRPLCARFRSQWNLPGRVPRTQRTEMSGIG